MPHTSIPVDMPHCELLLLLAQKSNERRDIDFNFLGKLDEFRVRISAEVRQINELFPEYTPHDEQYHLKRLFHVADTILGRRLLEGMNSAELFVLACGLYSHDWGMAVSEEERRYITTGIAPGSSMTPDFWLLPDERERFKRFLREPEASVRCRW